ncbi:MAG: PTS sugar transporter subunit IIA [bacterium]|nr:PTS sugar transporter subunit IIA [bacterium]
MKIVDFLTFSDVISDLRATTREGVLREMVDHLKEAGKITDSNRLVEILLDREMLGNTGIGYGVAIPHGRLEGLKDILLVFGKSVDGIEFDAHDGQPVNLFFLLVAPEDSAGLHLKALARISRIVKNPECRKALLESGDSESLFQVIQAEDERH